VLSLGEPRDAAENFDTYQKLTPPLYHPNFGGVPLDLMARVGVSPSRYLRLFSHEIIFEVFQRM